MREFGWRLLRKAVEVLPVRLDQRVRPERMSVQLIPTVKEISPPVRVHAKVLLIVPLSRAPLKVDGD